MAVYTLRGIIQMEVTEPSSPANRKVLVPALSSFPVPTGMPPLGYMSHVDPADPLDISRLSVTQWGAILDDGIPDDEDSQRLHFVGARYLNLQYTLTGEEAISARIWLVWDTEIDPIETQYLGG